MDMNRISKYSLVFYNYAHVARLRISCYNYHNSCLAIICINMESYCGHSGIF
jgi:hypothetical protein